MPLSPDIGIAGQIGSHPEVMDWLTAMTARTYSHTADHFHDLGFTRDWNAETVTAGDGNGVQTWTDSINSATLTQSSAGARPTCRETGFWGRVIQFDGGDVYDFGVQTTLDANFAVIAVGLFSADTLLFGSASSAKHIRAYRSSAAGVISIADATNDRVSSAAPHSLTTMFNVLTWRVTADVASLYVNGWNISPGTATLDETVVADNFFGYGGAGAGTPFGTGYVKRVLVKQSALSDADMKLTWRRLHNSIGGVHGP